MHQDDQRNFFLAMILIAVAMLIYSYMTPKPAPEAPPAAPSVAASSAPSSTPPTVVGSPAVSAAAPAIAPRRQVLGQTPRVRIETARVSGSINLKGARLDDLMLRDYRETIEKGAPNVRVLNPSGTAAAFFSEFGWVGAGQSLPSAATVWAADRATLEINKPVTLRWANGTGLEFAIRVSIDQNYMFTVAQSVRNTTATPVVLAPYGLISRSDPPTTQGNYVMHEGPMGVFVAKPGEDSRLHEEGYDALREDGPVESAASVGGWIGITDKYWMAALAPDQKASFRAQFRALEGNRYQSDFLYEAATVAPAATQTTTTHLFAGAKEVNLIDAYEKQLGIRLFDRAIDWGWFYYLTRPLFFLLDYLYKLFGNFGLAIIGLTMIVRLILFPLANKQFSSMNKMKLIQPKFKEIQERYKEDRAAQQKALMELYSKEKINPLAGCLPILLQIPIFFALYKVLFVTIEMRHQPFYLWLKDLSAPDPLTPVNLFGLLPFTPPTFGLFTLAIGILPIIMGVTMWLQMKLNPTPMTDPIQQKIFGWFPFIFTFMLAPFAAGLVLYWTTNNLLSILQQWILLKRHPAPAKAT